MRRNVARAAAGVQPGELLPSRYWTQLDTLRVPGSEERIDRVLVGPSGVHVVTDLPGHDGGDLEAAAQRASALATDVAGVLPARYRHVVTAHVCLGGLTGTATDLGGVIVGSPDMLEQAWRHRRRVVSTSEAAVLVKLLGDRLEPFPEPAAPRRTAWWRRWRRRWVVAGAAAMTGVAASGVAAVAADLPAVWGSR